MFLIRIASIFVLLAAASPALAADNDEVPITAADRSTIEATITAQMEAFQRDDGETAFSFAAPSIRARFRDPETFMAMVRVGYRAVYRPMEVRFLSLGRFRGVPTQRVLVVDSDGVPFLAFYTMERQEDGEWRIQGVILERAKNAEI